MVFVSYVSHAGIAMRSITLPEKIFDWCFSNFRSSR
jgi:hypothetical protein